MLNYDTVEKIKNMTTDEQITVSILSAVKTLSELKVVDDKYMALWAYIHDYMLVLAEHRNKGCELVCMLNEEMHNITCECLQEYVVKNANEDVVKILASTDDCMVDSIAEYEFEGDIND